MPDGFWVDAAQIISAVATAASVGVSLWLARRSETPRLRSFPGWRTSLTVGPVPRSARDAVSTELTLTVVNSGVLPVRVRMVSLDCWFGSRRGWSGRMECYVDERTAILPLTLQHGEEATFRLPIQRAESPWTQLANDWWGWRKMKFEVWTSLGAKHHRMSRKEFHQLRRHVLNIQAA
jgi:hypothetical protein